MGRWLAAAAVAVVLAGCGAGSDATVTTTAAPPTTAVATTTTAVSIGKLIRDGNDPPSTTHVETTNESATITLSSKPGDMIWMHNVLTRLGFPEGTVEVMEQTRAIDGMQTADGEGATARWTYHPDDGLTVVIQRSA
jgi:ABC-type glycerol-3-phosphate transport system substrate-binding protein